MPDTDGDAGLPTETCSQGQGYGRVIILAILILTLNITFFDSVVINSLSCVRLTLLLPASACRVSSDCHSLGVSDAMHPRSPAGVTAVDYASIMHPYIHHIAKFLF